MPSMFSGLPNNLIMDIIKTADGGLYTHKKKMAVIFKQIHNQVPIYWYKDGCIPPNDCPMFWFELAWGGASDDSDEEYEDD